LNPQEEIRRRNERALWRLHVLGPWTYGFSALLIWLSARQRDDERELAQQAKLCQVWNFGAVLFLAVLGMLAMLASAVLFLVGVTSLGAYLAVVLAPVCIGFSVNAAVGFRNWLRMRKGLPPAYPLAGLLRFPGMSGGSRDPGTP